MQSHVTAPSEEPKQEQSSCLTVSLLGPNNNECVDVDKFLGEQVSLLNRKETLSCTAIRIPN